jgi:hypothetical protein
VEDLEIRNNFFDNCNYGVWGKALIDITPQIKPEHRGVPFHKNIRIHHHRKDVAQAFLDKLSTGLACVLRVFRM